MNHPNKPRYLLLALLLLAGVMALTGCSSTPLPPLFVMRGQGAAQAAQAASAAPVAVVPASEIAPTEIAPSEAAPAETLAAAPMATAAVDAGQVITPTAVVTAERASAVGVAPTATRVAPTATRVAPTATRAAPAATRAPARPAATPTPQWPRTLAITADDIEQGASSVPGLQVTGLEVLFGDNAMTMSFDSLRYSFVSLRNVTIQGHFTANNCDVDFVADSISPRNLATSAIPGFINQSLDQQLGAWCVESLTVQPGQLVASVRPRS